MARMSKRAMLSEMKDRGWDSHDLTEKSSWADIKDEYDVMIDECEGESSLFQNGRDYDAEDEDGPF